MMLRVTVFMIIVMIHQGIDSSGVANIKGFESKKGRVVVPISVESPAVVNIDPRSVLVTWNPPDFSDCITLDYIIKCTPLKFIKQPYSDHQADDVLKCLRALNHSDVVVLMAVDTTSVTLSRLIPFTLYEVSVLVNTLMCPGNFSDVTLFITVADDPGPIMKLEGTTQDSTSIVLSWEGPTCPNGVITGYYIYYRISNTIQSQPIISSGYTEERLISNERDVVYSLTDLKPGEYYAIHVRAFTIDDNGTELIGMADTEIFVELNDYSHLGYNVIVLTVCLVLAFVILCCLLIFIIVCCCWYCHRKPKYNSIATEESLPLLEYPSKSVKEPIAVLNYPHYVAYMHSNQDYEFSEEYLRIEPDHHPTQHASESNRVKNRYKQIPAYDHSRVVLNDSPNGVDYINANYIDGYKKSGNFIATQGPLPNTATEFWCMIWEQNVPVIIMLTNLVEKEMNKCHQYWPASLSETVDYDPFCVELMEEAEKKYQTIRSFSLSIKGSFEKRKVKQYHFTSWPDHGVPVDSKELLYLIDHIRNMYDPTVGPMVVHCNDGCGRMGSFIVIYVQMARVAGEMTVDIYNYVQYMRKQRPLMVSNEIEYIFIHDALLDALKMGMIERVTLDLTENQKNSPDEDIEESKRD